MSVVEVTDPAERSRPCETIPRDLPDARGFVLLEEIHGLWPGNPRLPLVKRL